MDIRRNLPDWTGKLDQTAWIYYQGKGTTQVQAVKYIDAKNFIGTTGESVRLLCDGINTIPREQLFIGHELDEVDFNYSQWNILNRILSAIKLWNRGIDVSRNEVEDYQPLYETNQQGSFNNCDIDLSKTSLGQQGDIEEHAKKYQSLQEKNNKKHPINNIILYGVSRGAATTFTAMAAHRDEYQNIKLCILEAPPASISDVLKNYVGSFLTKILYNQFTANLFLGKKHNTNKDKQAKAYIDLFPDNVPLVIISSRKDGLVPHESSIKLAFGVAGNRLASNNKHAAPVYWLQLDKPDHNDYTIKNSSDSKRYQNFIHAVYHDNDLAHIEEFAKKGQLEMSTSLLTGGLLTEIVKLQHEFMRNKNGRVNIRNQALNLFTNTFEDSSEYERNRAASICAAMPLFAKQLNFFDNDSITAKELLTRKIPDFFSRNPMIRDIFIGIIAGACVLLVIGLIGYFMPPLLGVVGVLLAKISLGAAVGTGLGFIAACAGIIPAAGKFARWLWDKICNNEIAPGPNETSPLYPEKFRSSTVFFGDEMEIDFEKRKSVDEKSEYFNDRTMENPLEQEENQNLLVTDMDHESVGFKI